MPPKIGIIQKSREVIDYYVIKLPWANINPSLISFTAIPLSLAFIFLWDDYKFLAFIFLNLTLIVDWLDGIIAKKYDRASEKGWIIDTVTDRISEGIIFLKFFHPWFYLFLLNILFTFIIYRLKRFSIHLPLRQLFFLYLVALFSFYYFFTR